MRRKLAMPRATQHEVRQTRKIPIYDRVADSNASDERVVEGTGGGDVKSTYTMR